MERVQVHRQRAPHAVGVQETLVDGHLTVVEPTTLIKGTNALPPQHDLRLLADHRTRFALEHLALLAPQHHRRHQVVQLLRDAIRLQLHLVARLLVLPLLDGRSEVVRELLLLAEKAVIAQPVHEIPDLEEVVLERRARDEDAVVRVDCAHALRHFGIAVANLR